MVKDAPRVHDIECAETLDIVCIQDGPALDPPAVVVGEKAILELASAENRILVLVERVDLGTEAPSRQRKEATAAPNVEKFHAGK